MLLQRALFTFYSQYMSSFQATTGRPCCSPSIHTWHSCTARVPTSASLHTRVCTPCTGRRLSAEWRQLGRWWCIYVFILTDCYTNIYAARERSLSLYIHRPSTDIARQRSKTIGHSNSLLDIRNLVFQDSGWLQQIRILKNPPDLDVAG